MYIVQAPMRGACLPASEDTASGITSTTLGCHVVRVSRHRGVGLQTGRMVVVLSLWCVSWGCSRPLNACTSAGALRGRRGCDRQVPGDIRVRPRRRGASPAARGKKSVRLVSQSLSVCLSPSEHKCTPPEWPFSAARRTPRHGLCAMHRRTVAPYLAYERVKVLVPGGRRREAKTLLFCWPHTVVLPAAPGFHPPPVTPPHSHYGALNVPPGSFYPTVRPSRRGQRHVLCSTPGDVLQCCLF